MTQQARDLYTYGKNYKWFALLFCISLFFFFLSLCFLPVFFIMPKKTATMFNMGMIIMLIAFGIQQGFHKFFCEKFFCAPRPRNFLAIGFLISMLLTVWFAIIKDKWIGSLIFLLIEFAFLIYFLASYFPGGMAGVSYFFKFVWEAIKSACTRCCSSSNSQ